MSDGPARVLVVEDEESFVEALRVGLRREGFVVDIARDGREALQQFNNCTPDLVLLDVMLPKISGIDVCRQIRMYSQVPIIMLSAKGEEIDTVVGLEVGADDYVAKPYRLRELVARMRSLLRRSNWSAEDSEVIGDGLLRADGIVLDKESHVVTLRGDEVQLPLKEFQLLAILMANKGIVVTRDVLIDRVWGHDYVGDTKTLDVHIKRLRAKFESKPEDPSVIVTIRGLGYKVVD